MNIKVKRVELVTKTTVEAECSRRVEIYMGLVTLLGQWLILRVVLFEHILSIFVFISLP